MKPPSSSILRLSAAAARQRFSDLLDAAERGENVVIERRGVRFELVSRRPSKGRRRQRSLIEWVDPAVESGQWSWELGAEGLAFVPRPGAR
jgi:prevent-host-death family protein